MSGWIRSFAWSSFKTKDRTFIEAFKASMAHDFAGLGEKLSWVYINSLPSTMKDRTFKVCFAWE